MNLLFILNKFKKLLIHLQQKNTQIVTLGKAIKFKINRKNDLSNINIPKVFFNEHMLATGFERKVNFNDKTKYYYHIGIYGYTKKI